MSNGGAEAIHGAFLRDVGVEVRNAELLARRLADDFTVEHFGFAQFDDIVDPVTRAVVSDQAWSSADAVTTNLVEARIHELDLTKLVGERGVSRASSVNDYYRDTRSDLQIVGFFRALGSTLDCLAGTTIAVTRFPRSIHKASMARDLFDVDPTAAPDEATAAVWTELRDRVDAARAGPPTDWMEWALQYRHALLHRPRQINVMVPRPRQSRIIIPRSALWDVLRFDLHLRRKPWLPEMQHLAGPHPNAEELFLAERVTQTMRGLFERLNQVTEAFAEWLLNLWERTADGAIALRAPGDRWALTDDPPITFAGIDPGDVNAGDAIAGHPLTVKRLQVAERLRHL